MEEASLSFMLKGEEKALSFTIIKNQGGWLHELQKEPGRCFVRIVVVFHCSWCLFHLLRSKGIIHYAKLGKVVKGTIFLLFAKRTPLPLMLVQPKICLVAPADLKHHVDGSHSINKPTYFDTLPRELFAKVCFHYFLFGFFFFFLFQRLWRYLYTTSILLIPRPLNGLRQNGTVVKHLHKLIISYFIFLINFFFFLNREGEFYESWLILCEQQTLRESLFSIRFKDIIFQNFVPNSSVDQIHHLKGVYLCYRFRFARVIHSLRHAADYSHQYIMETSLRMVAQVLQSITMNGRLQSDW